MTDRIAYAVDPVDPYSKVIRAGELVFVKSQIGGNADGAYPDDIAAQTRNAIGHVEHALELAGVSLKDVLKINIYLSNIDRDFDQMDEAYLAAFAERGIAEKPARTTIGAPLSWPQLLVQMDAVAVTR